MCSSNECADEARMLLFLWQLTTSPRKSLSRSLARLIVWHVDPSVTASRSIPKCRCCAPQRFSIGQRQGAMINVTTVVDALYGSTAYHVDKHIANATVSASRASGFYRFDSTRLSRFAGEARKHQGLYVFPLPECAIHCREVHPSLSIAMRRNSGPTGLVIQLWFCGI